MVQVEYNAVENASFRDPAGFFWIQDERALRWISSDYQKEVLEFLNHIQTKKWIEEKKIVATRLLSIEEQAQVTTPLSGLSAGILLEHFRIPFPSYPYEWSPAMLFEAAKLTLDLAEQSLEFGFSLKDATPYNILFDGSKPCLIDFLSFEKRNPLDGTWKPYGQFVRTFLLPLLAQKELGVSLKEVFLSSREGLQTSDFYKRLGFFRRLLPYYFTLITLPEWLTRKNRSFTTASYNPKLLSSQEQAKFVLKSLFKHLRKKLLKLEPKTISSHWKNYSVCSHCTPEYQQKKEEWICDFLNKNSVTNVFDVGCNTGHYSKLFAKHNASLVSIDLDTAVIDSFWLENRNESRDIISLVLDLAWPSPSLGWENKETKSFLKRASNHFEMVLMYAVLHHLLVGAQIPLSHIVKLAAQLTQKWLIIEYIDPQDSMFQSLVRGRGDLYEYLNVQTFEKYFEVSFEIIKKQELAFIPRTLYLMKKK